MSQFKRGESVVFQSEGKEISAIYLGRTSPSTRSGSYLRLQVGRREHLIFAQGAVGQTVRKATS